MSQLNSDPVISMEMRSKPVFDPKRPSGLHRMLDRAGDALIDASLFKRRPSV